jgi:hypothetical protein
MMGFADDAQTGEEAQPARKSTPRKPARPAVEPPLSHRDGAEPAESGSGCAFRARSRARRRPGPRGGRDAWRGCDPRVPGAGSAARASTGLGGNPSPCLGPRPPGRPRRARRSGREARSGVRRRTRRPRDPAISVGRSAGHRRRPPCASSSRRARPASPSSRPRRATSPAPSRRRNAPSRAARRAPRPKSRPTPSDSKSTSSPWSGTGSATPSPRPTPPVRKPSPRAERLEAALRAARGPSGPVPEGERELRAEVVGLRRRLEESSAESRRLRETIDLQATDLSIARAHRDDRQNEIDQFRRRIETLESERAAQVDRIDEALARQRELLALVSRIQAENVELRSTQAALEETLEARDLEISAREEHLLVTRRGLAARDEQLIDAAERLEQARHRHELLEAELERARLGQSELEEKLLRREARIASLSKTLTRIEDAIGRPVAERAAPAAVTAVAAVVHTEPVQADTPSERASKPIQPSESLEQPATPIPAPAPIASPAALPAPIVAWRNEKVRSLSGEDAGVPGFLARRLVENAGGSNASPAPDPESRRRRPRGRDRAPRRPRGARRPWGLDPCPRSGRGHGSGPPPGDRGRRTQRIDLARPLAGRRDRAGSGDGCLAARRRSLAPDGSGVDPRPPRLAASTGRRRALRRSDRRRGARAVADDVREAGRALAGAAGELDDDRGLRVPAEPGRGCGRRGAAL